MQADTMAFLFSLLPQFVDNAHPMLPQMLLLAATHATFGLVWLLILVAALDGGGCVGT